MLGIYDKRTVDFKEEKTLFGKNLVVLTEENENRALFPFNRIIRMKIKTS